MRVLPLVIGGVLAGGLALGAAMVFSGSGASDSAPTLFEWEDYAKAPFLAEYERAYNEKPKTSIFADEDEAFAKLRAGFKPDVMGPCYYEFPRWQEAGLLQPIDTGKLKNWEKLSPSLRELPGLVAGEGKVWFVPHYWGNTSITYRTDLAPEYVGHESWNILFDPKYKGRVAVLEGVDDTVPFIAKMIGIDAYNMSDADWERVKAKLKEVIAQVRFVSSDETSLAQGLASGELVAAMSWRVTFRTLQSQGKPVAYMNPPGGIFTYVCGLTVAKGTANYDKSLALLDSEIGDDAADVMVRTIGDGPANVEQLMKEPDSVFQSLGIPRDIEAFLKSGTFQRRLKNKDAIVNAWSEIRAGL
ncbi:MAG TPA: extracellular solute-binding protein [Micropepsaceae bacterium]|nr:extracellular solute-binding protein [Micropepsaceae bacterium]